MHRCICISIDAYVYAYVYVPPGRTFSQVKLADNLLWDFKVVLGST